jgi:hypothetical protein
VGALKSLVANLNIVTDKTPERAPMERLFSQKNIERYRRMLDNPRDDAQRRIILQLLSEEEALRDQAAQADEAT